MQHARDRIRELTDRKRLPLPVQDIVQDINTFLRGWTRYFRYANTAHHLDAINDYAARRLALFVAKRHTRRRAYGWSVLAVQSSNRLGLIALHGIVAAPRPNRDWRG
jgi:RNA-directed DNA polymerase